MRWDMAGMGLLTAAVALMAAGAAQQITGHTQITINRHFKGDNFVKPGCHGDFCEGNGTRYGQVIRERSPCECQCDPAHPTFREDTATCIADIQGCILADFISGSSHEKIPFVFLPLSGQLVYPSAEIAISEVDSRGELVVAPICVVSRVEMMTQAGWRDIDNVTDTFQQPFQLFRDGDKTYVQWMGGEVLHQMLEGRLVLIHLLCKDTGRPGRQLFSPCISFRIAGSPGAAVVRGRQSDRDSGLTQRDYLAIGICAGFLGMVYIFAIFVFVIIKRKKRRKERLRQQFLNMPLPQGLGYKSSRILGLEQEFIPELGKLHEREMAAVLAGKKYQASCHLHERNGLATGHADQFSGKPEPVYDITKPSHSGSESDTSDASVVLEMNEKLLEAHKKVVQKNIRSEVARDICSVEEESVSGENKNTDFDVSNSGSEAGNITDEEGKSLDGDKSTAAHEFLTKMRVLINSTKAKMAVNRFAPNLTDIPEENALTNTFGRKIKTSAFDNPNFVDEERDRETTEETEEDSTSNQSSVKDSNDAGRDNFVLKKNKDDEMHLMPKFNEVNAKIYESFRHELPSKRKDSQQKGEAGEGPSPADSLPREETLDSFKRQRGTSDPQSLDSGVITTPSGSASPLSNQSDQGNGGNPETDDDVVNVADSEEESESEPSETEGEGVSERYESEDSAAYFDSLRPNSKNSHNSKNSQNSKNSSNNSEHTGKSSLSMGRRHTTVPTYVTQNEMLDRRKDSKDFVRDLFDRAVAKVPKVIPSDTESLYSTNSTMRKEYENDSLEVYSASLKDVYRKPDKPLLSKKRLVQAKEAHTRSKGGNTDDDENYETVGFSNSNDTKSFGGESGIYVNKEYASSTLGSVLPYSESDTEQEDEDKSQMPSGETMMISINGDDESVYSNKLLIEVDNNYPDELPSKDNATFDPDTLERGALGKNGYGSSDSLESPHGRSSSSKLKRKNSQHFDPTQDGLGRADGNPSNGTLMASPAMMGSHQSLELDEEQSGRYSFHLFSPTNKNVPKSFDFGNSSSSPTGMYPVSLGGEPSTPSFTEKGSGRLASMPPMEMHSENNGTRPEKSPGKVSKLASRFENFGGSSETIASNSSSDLAKSSQHSSLWVSRHSLNSTEAFCNTDHNNATTEDEENESICSSLRPPSLPPSLPPKTRSSPKLPPKPSTNQPSSLQSRPVLPQKQRTGSYKAKKSTSKVIPNRPLPPLPPPDTSPPPPPPPPPPQDFSSPQPQSFSRKSSSVSEISMSSSSCESSLSGNQDLGQQIENSLGQFQVEMNGNDQERSVNNSNSVMQRIQETEMEEYCSKLPQDGVSKGMEIALNLRSRMKQDHLAKQSPLNDRSTRSMIGTPNHGDDSPPQQNRAGVVKKLNKIFSTFIDENQPVPDNEGGHSSLTSSVSPFESCDSSGDGSSASSLSRSSGSSLGQNGSEQFHTPLLDAKATPIKPISYRKFKEDANDSGNNNPSARIYRL